MGFLDKKYLLGNKTAVKIFKKVASLPVVDPHNHADVKEIAENKNYINPWQVFAATDHYVWEMLRKCGVPEVYITGNAPAEEKWRKMAEAFPLIAGNPVYEWVHLDLQRCFGIDEPLCKSTGKKTWKAVAEKLKLPCNRPREILRRTNVEVMCSTDDPADILDVHMQINRVMGSTIIRPTWRPDRAIKITSTGWRRYIERLAGRFAVKCRSIKDVEDVLRRSHDYFAECGCRASDHGVERPLAGTEDRKDANRVFMKALQGGTISSGEANVFAGYLFGFMGELDAEKDWVFQLHIGAVRDVGKTLFETLGADSGGDVSSHFIDILPPLTSFLNRFDNRLKTVLYCLDAVHYATLASTARAFGAKVRLGSAWWLCDNPIGMKRQLEYIGSVDLLSAFAGMVSDSRKILSYGSRFEMFRRVLSDVLGGMAEMGQMTEETAEALAKRMCYTNPKEFFNL
ncbi:MAG: glucuronate isomerase [Candidatus Omnitrophica bacterium]|nr:glucuronate isomerase [Candidatus Omnitrophota bacterium]